MGGGLATTPLLFSKNKKPFPIENGWFSLKYILD
jgi:hypothetical protein